MMKPIFYLACLHMLIVCLPGVISNDINRHYKPPYHIAGILHQFDGFIENDARIGSRVKVEDPEITGEDINYQYLRLELINVNFTQPAEEHKHLLSSNMMPVSTEGLTFRLTGTESFIVTERGYIEVHKELPATDGDHYLFFVVLIQHNFTVSNPVPIRINLEFLPETEEHDALPHASAVYAGVLVLLIVFFALFIPTVVRAKRRFKEGKPMFTPGSARPSICVENQNRLNLPRNSTTVLNLTGYDNEAMSLEDDMKRQKMTFGSTLVRMNSKQVTATNAARQFLSNRRISLPSSESPLPLLKTGHANKSIPVIVVDDPKPESESKPQTMSRL